MLVCCCRGSSDRAGQTAPATGATPPPRPCAPEGDQCQELCGLHLAKQVPGADSGAHGCPELLFKAPQMLSLKGCLWQVPTAPHPGGRLRLRLSMAPCTCTGPSEAALLCPQSSHVSCETSPAGRLSTCVSATEGTAGGRGGTLPSSEPCWRCPRTSSLGTLRALHLCPGGA